MKGTTMNSMLNASKVIAVMAALGLALAGCGQKSNTGTTGSSGSSGTSSSGGSSGTSGGSSGSGSSGSR